MALKALYRDRLGAYGGTIDLERPMWQPRYYGFNVYTEAKAREKLDYMHKNPVKAGLVEHPEDWPYSSARWYLLGRSVGLDMSPPG